MQAFSWRPSSSPSLGPAGEVECPGNRRRTTSCRAPATSLRPSTSLVPVLEAAGNRSPFPVSVTYCLGRTLWDLVCPIWVTWEDWRPAELGTWLPQQWQLGRMWESGPKGAANCNPPSQRQDWDLGGLKLCLKTLPFFVRTENKSCAVENHKNTITWLLPHHDLTSTAKDLTPKSLQQLTMPLPHRLLLKGFAESFQ